MSEILQELEGKEPITLSESFRFAQSCSRLLFSDKKDDQACARAIIICVLDNWAKVHRDTWHIWLDLVEAAGFYPYLLKKQQIENLSINGTAGLIRNGFHKSDFTGKYFHEEQKKYNDFLLSENNSRNLILSAPTSFGKSLLIEEIVASKKYNNIVVIQPTLALLDETRRKLKKYEDSYKIIVRTSQEPSLTKKNLFLLTAERVMEYENLPRIDFLIIDEFYKLSDKRDKERSDVLNNAFYTLTKNFNCMFYLLGPNVDGISQGFKEKYNAEFEQTNYTLVDNRINNDFCRNWGRSKSDRSEKERQLFQILDGLKGQQTLIYCSSPGHVRSLSMKYCEYLKQKNSTENEKSICDVRAHLIEWIQTYVSPDWGLIDCLKNKIGVHDGALQRHITTTIINYFNMGVLDYLFCTSTIIEGVNTSAKNVIIFDNRKGHQQIDYFDYSNIKGRSGRLMSHYVGNVFNFYPPPPKTNVIINIPFFDQQDTSDEILIQLAESDVKNKTSSNYLFLKDIPEKEREIFRKNGVLVKGQIEILKTLRRDIDIDEKMITWTGFPERRQLEYLLKLGWDNLLKEGESKVVWTLDQLLLLTFNYTINGQNISQLISESYDFFSGLPGYANKGKREIFDDSVTFVYQVIRHWFNYKIPKWLNVVDSLQALVCEEKGKTPGNYTFYASKIENDFVQDNLAVLVEYGIPKSAIDKLQHRLAPDLTEDEIIAAIKTCELVNMPNLMQYEKDKIKECLIVNPE